MSGKDIDEQYRKRLLNSYSESHATVRKLAAMGRFYLSEDACAALKEYIRHKKLDWGNVAPYEWFENCSSSAHEAVEKIRSAAMRDLKLRPWWMLTRR